MATDLDTVREMCRDGRLKGAHKDPDTGGWLIPESSLGAWSKPESPALAESGGRNTFKNIRESQIAAGPGASVVINRGAGAAEIADAFEKIYSALESRRQDPDVAKEEIATTVRQIEEEVQKGEAANENKVNRWLKTLALMAPDIFEVTIDTLVNPLSGIKTVVQKIAQKAKEEAGGSG